MPETWLKTEDLISHLKENKTDLFTVTNHNNARSCWELLEKGHDVLPGAEFTCFFKDFKVYTHVLISTLIASASFGSAKVLYHSRPVLNEVAGITGKYKHPQKILWLTDTLFDHNGVSSALQNVLEYSRGDGYDTYL